MKPVPISHNEYRASLRNGRRQYYPDASKISKDTWTIYNQFKKLDLSRVDTLMQDKYSLFGPPPWPPSAMLRSLLLAVKVKVFSITAWVRDLQINPLYAIISGFQPYNVPGVGTFYDFMSRLWDGIEDNFSPHMKAQPVKVEKPKGRGKKAASVERENVKELIKRLSDNSFIRGNEPYNTLFTLFYSCFVSVSIQSGLIRPGNIRMSGDGTPVVTSARMRSHHTCDCVYRGIYNCNCDRYYSQPDCDFGWDSSRDRFYFGYAMYVLTDSAHDLPLFALLHPASKHDSHSFCEAFFRLRAFAPDLMPSQLVLDSAHDNMATYRLCQQDNITPFIDLNLGNSKKAVDYHGVTLGPDGIPVCSAKHKMKSNGNDLHRQYAKFRCPLMNRTTCSCPSPCSKSKYGRTCSVPLDSNPRLYNTPPRGSQEWKKIYSSRTASERCNKRMKIDFLLENGRHRSSKLWYIRAYMIMMVQHLDAWDSAAK